MVPNLLNWFNIKPNTEELKPKITTPETRLSWKYENTSHKLYVSVKSAINIPKKLTVTSRNSSPYIQVTQNHRIGSYVEVSFGNAMSRTGTKEGANPAWNKELVFPVE